MEDLAYELSSPLEYARDGDTETTKSVTLKACSYKQRREYLKLKNCMFKAFMGLSKLGEGRKSKAKQTNEEHVVTKKEVVTAFALADNELEIEALEVFESIVFKVGELEPGVDLKPLHLENMGTEVALDMMGAYVAHFIGPSFASTMRADG